MTREDINNIIQALCPNDDDFEKPIISPAYLKTELEALALEQKPCGDAIDRDEAIRIASGYCHFSNIPKELAKLPPVTVEPKTDVLDKIKGYVNYIRNTGMGKNKSLEFIEKFIEGLKAESEIEG